jgi:hypothetical protein
VSAFERFAAVPERFTAALRARQITYRQYGLGIYLLATANHYTRELTRTLEQLSAEQGFPKGRDSLSRDLRALETGGWITCQIGPGKSLWTITITGLLRGTSAGPSQHLRTKRPDFAEVASARERDKEADIPHGDKLRDDLEPPHAATALDVDVEEENPPNPPEGGERGTSRMTTTERRAARFVAKLTPEQLAAFKELPASTQAEIVSAQFSSTGLRETRGSMGRGFKSDPLGCDPKPPPTFELPPDYDGRVNPSTFFTAWIERERRTAA